MLTWFPTSITCTLPSNPHGSYPVLVEVQGNGWADTSAVPNMQYTLLVTGLSPVSGSLLGGTRLEVVGAGFQNCSSISVSLGSQLGCEVELDTCSDSRLYCTTVRTPVIHQVLFSPLLKYLLLTQCLQVNNGGRHKAYGLGYVWSRPELEILPGDTVEWVWRLQTSSKETGISVHQVMFQII